MLGKSNVDGCFAGSSEILRPHRHNRKETDARQRIDTKIRFSEEFGTG